MLMEADRDVTEALRPLAEPDVIELHPIGAWYVIRTEPRMEKTARLWLLRVGIEAWYPQGKRVKLKALRHLPSKTRHKRKREAICHHFPAVPGYVLARDVVGIRYGREICELPGVLGLCCFGATLATIQDYEVEILRRKEAAGVFDVFGTYEAEDTYAKQQERYQVSGRANKQWEGRSKVMYRTCESGEIVTFRENLGRIDRVITLKDTTSAAR